MSWSWDASVYCILQAVYTVWTSKVPPVLNYSVMCLSAAFSFLPLGPCCCCGEAWAEHSIMGIERDRCLGAWWHIFETEIVPQWVRGWKERGIIPFLFTASVMLFSCLWLSCSWPATAWLLLALPATVCNYAWFRLCFKIKNSIVHQHQEWWCT